MSIHPLSIPPVLPVAKGLVLWLPFNDRSGSKALDRSGKGNHGTLYGPSWVAGKRGSALSFDGVDDYVSVPHSDSLNISDVISLVAWVYMVSYSSNLWGYVICKYTHDTYSFIVGGTTSTGVPRFHIGGTYLDSVAPYATLPLNTWLHIVCTYDGAYMRMFINGTLNSKGPIVKAIPTNTESLLIGDRWDHTRHFNGVIDEVRIYNRALTAAEIKRLYEAGRLYMR